MTFTITEMTRCPGGGHWICTATVNGVSRTFELDKSDLDAEPGDVRSAALRRIRSVLLEAGATTWPQVRTALIGKEFKA